MILQTCSKYFSKHWKLIVSNLIDWIEFQQSVNPKIGLAYLLFITKANEILRNNGCGKPIKLQKVVHLCKLFCKTLKWMHSLKILLGYCSTNFFFHLLFLKLTKTHFNVLTNFSIWTFWKSLYLIKPESHFQYSCRARVN